MAIDLLYSRAPVGGKYVHLWTVFTIKVIVKSWARAAPTSCFPVLTPTKKNPPYNHVIHKSLQYQER